MSKAVWITSFGEGTQDKLHALLDAFRKTDIEFSSGSETSECTAAVVIFDPNDVGVIPFVQQEVAGRNLRIVGIAAEPDALAPELVWPLLDAGFLDTFRWIDQVELLGRMVAARLTRWNEIDAILDSSMVRRNLVGESESWISTLRGIVEAAYYSDRPILLTGETGTGKELCARLIHTLTANDCKGELITVDCTTVMPELSGSEFFGHERGAYTGASGPREGAFALADGGTLFLDEIGELRVRLQAQLLRVIQEHRYKRVGGNNWRSTSFRLVSATNRDLAAEVEHGAFRSDLFYRISGCTFALPPLRERPEDILLLSHHFLHEALGCDDPPNIDPAVQALLLSRDFPGNVRELRQLITRMAVSHVGVGPLTVGDLPLEERPSAGMVQFPVASCFEPAVRRALSLGMGLKDIGRSATETAIRIAIRDEKGNLSRAARRLSITPRALQLRVADWRSRSPAARRLLSSGDHV